MKKGKNKPGEGKLAEMSAPGRHFPLWTAGLLILLLFAAWHFLDVRAGAIQSGDRFLLSWYGVLAVVMLAFLGGAGYLFFEKKLALETVFAVCVLGLGALYLTVLPPLSAPDEVSHFISAYRLSNTLMGQPGTDERGRVYIRKQDAFILDTDLVPGESLDGLEETVDTEVLGQTLTECTYRKIHGTGLLGTGDQEMETTVKPPVETTPIAYLPQALGIVLGRLTGLGGLGLLYLGRLGNLLCYTGAAWYAMKRLPFGKEVLFGVGLLPMTLHLAASFSYDTMVLAMSFLLTAVTLSLAFGAADVRKRYGAAMILVNSRTIAMYAAETESYVGWADEAGYTLGWLIHNPVKTLRLFYNTVLIKGEYYHLTMMGNWLGNLDPVLDVPYVLVWAMTIVLLLLAMKKPGGETIYFSGKQKLWTAVVCLGCAGATMLSMLIAWTPASSGHIMGVQGRYFLPFLPVFLLILKNNWIALTKNRDRGLLYFMACANGYALLRLFSIVSIRI